FRQVVPDLGRCGRRNLVAKDRGLQRLELDSGLDPELFVQGTPRSPIGGQRVRLALRPVQREHQLTPEDLAVRMLANETLQLTGTRGPLPEGELGLYPPLYASEAPLLEAIRLGSEHTVVAQLAERPVPPEPESLARPIGCDPRPSPRECRLGLPDQPFEAP